MRRKSAGKRRVAACATANAPSLFAIPLLSDEHNATAFDSESDDDHRVHHCPEPVLELVDCLDKSICLCCDDKGEEGVLVCSEMRCPVTVHSNCIGSEPKFDDSGNFYCPYCWYKRVMDTCQQLREKSLVAKKALSHFLDSGARADSAVARAGPIQDGKECVEETQYEENNNKDEEKVSVSVTVSSVSETNDSEPNVISVKKRKDQRKDPSARRKRFLQQEEHKHYNTRRKIVGNVREEEVTSFQTLRRPQTSPLKGMKRTSLTAKRKRLLWTAEEEKVLKMGRLKSTTGLAPTSLNKGKRPRISNDSEEPRRGNLFKDGQRKKRYEEISKWSFIQESRVHLISGEFDALLEGPMWRNWMVLANPMPKYDTEVVLEFCAT